MQLMLDQLTSRHNLTKKKAAIHVIVFLQTETLKHLGFCGFAIK